MAKRRKPGKAPKVPRTRGRPAAFTPAIGRAICERLAEGESLRTICAGAGMPGRSTVLRWLSSNPEFRGQYAHAREAQADLLADDVVDIADAADDDSVNLARLRIDARKWFASKLVPRKYGERLATEVSGPDGGPIELQPLPPPMMPAEVAAELARLVRKAQGEVGLRPGGRGSLAKKVAAIVATGQPLPPDLYAALHASRKEDRGAK